MLSKSILAVAISIGAANASPVLNKRQATATLSVTSTESPASSTEAMSSMASATEAMSSMASMSMEMSTTMMSEQSASTPGATPSATSTDIAGQMYPLYPCPEGSELVYVQANMTVPIPIDQLTQQAGEWATSPIFPNVTESTGGSTVGATHTWNIMDIPYIETLVNSTSDQSGSAFLQWTYNSTAPLTIMNQTTMMNTTIENYQTVFKAYDPTFSSLMERGNTTFLQIFTNACSSSRESAQMQLQMVNEMQLGLLASNSTGSGQVLTSTVATQSETATNTEAVTATSTVGATSIESLTQTDTIVPVTASTTASTEQVTSTAATETATTTDQTAFTTAATQSVTASTPLTTVESTVATTTAA